MEKEINVKELMKGTPRPHYLVGNGKYVHENSEHRLSTKVNFVSEGHPSIADRRDKYLSKPHVNVGDCCFALWNAVHIIAYLNECKSRTLREKILVEPKKLIPSDTELDLEVLVKDKNKKSIRGKLHSLGTIQGVFYQDGVELIKITTDYMVER